MSSNTPTPVNTTTPIPSSDTSSGAPPAATSSSIPASFMGPQPAPSSTPTLNEPQPKGDNSAPPPITNPTSPTKPNTPSLATIIGTILFFVLGGYGIYYGWIMGMQKGREYLLFVQSFGPWLRSFFIKPKPISTRVI